MFALADDFLFDFAQKTKYPYKNWHFPIKNKRTWSVRPDVIFSLAKNMLTVLNLVSIHARMRNNEHERSLTLKILFR